MTHYSTNPAWTALPSTTTPINAGPLENIELAIDGLATSVAAVTPAGQELNRASSNVVTSAANTATTIDMFATFSFTMGARPVLVIGDVFFNPDAQNGVATLEVTDASNVVKASEPFYFQSTQTIFRHQAVEYLASGSGTISRKLRFRLASGPGILVANSATYPLSFSTIRVVQV